mmetsp:Transcript_42875/g.109692  ORF Transcript_42875/g.109692 Transcript_42875/m.109692 type:complete len:416 (-) Transcript_42875:402-1649(-)
MTAQKRHDDGRLRDFLSLATREVEAGAAPHIPKQPAAQRDRARVRNPPALRLPRKARRQEGDHEVAQILQCMHDEAGGEAGVPGGGPGALVAAAAAVRHKGGVHDDQHVRPGHPVQAERLARGPQEVGVQKAVLVGVVTVDLNADAADREAAATACGEMEREAVKDGAAAGSGLDENELLPRVRSIGQRGPAECAVGGCEGGRHEGGGLLHPGEVLVECARAGPALLWRGGCRGCEPPEHAARSRSALCCPAAAILPPHAAEGCVQWGAAEEVLPPRLLACLTAGARTQPRIEERSGKRVSAKEWVGLPFPVPLLIPTRRQRRRDHLLQLLVRREGRQEVAERGAARRPAQIPQLLQRPRDGERVAGAWAGDPEDAAAGMVRACVWRGRRQPNEGGAEGHTQINNTPIKVYPPAF